MERRIDSGFPQRPADITFEPGSKVDRLRNRSVARRKQCLFVGDSGRHIPDLDVRDPAEALGDVLYPPFKFLFLTDRVPLKRRIRLWDEIRSATE